MHYPSTAFGIDGAKTMRSLRGLENLLMGQLDSLALTDIKTVRETYPYALVVGIEGEQFLFGERREFTRQAAAGGGTAPYAFTWWIDYGEMCYGCLWERIPEGDGSPTLTMYVDECSGNFALQVRVGDSDPYGAYRGQTAPFVIENWLVGGEICS